MADQAGTTNNAGGGQGPASGSDGGNGGRAPDGRVMAGELAPFAEDPAIGGEDSNFILATLFGDGNAAGAGDGQQRQASDQGSSGNQGGQGNQAAGTNDGGQQGGSASSSAASTAAQGGGAPQELAPFPGTTNQQDASGGQQQSQSGTQGGQPSGQASQPGQGGQTGGLTPEDRLLIRNQQATIDALQNQVRQLLERQPAGQGQQGQPAGSGNQSGQPQQPAQDPTVLTLAAPNDVVQAIFDENPATAHAGVNHLISAVATATLRQARAIAEQIVDERLSGFRGDLTAQTEEQRIKSDFYGAFPALNNRLFDQVVSQESQAMWTANPSLPWDENSRNALGQRVINNLRSLGFNLPLPGEGGGQQQGGGNVVTAFGGNQQQGHVPQEAGPVAGANGATTSNGTTRPAAMMGAGTRPADDQGGQRNFIVDTLG